MGLTKHTWSGGGPNFALHSMSRQPEIGQIPESVAADLKAVEQEIDAAEAELGMWFC